MAEEEDQAIVEHPHKEDKPEEDEAVIDISEALRDYREPPKPSQRLKGKPKVPVNKPALLEFPGKNIICCKGRCVTSSGYLWLPFTFILIIFPFTIFVPTTLSDFIATMSIWPVLPCLFLLIMSLCSCIATAVTDPGVLPRGLNPRSAVHETAITGYMTDQIRTKLIFHQLNPEYLLGKEIIRGGESIYLKYCNTCEIFRPPRASHCSYCDNCVEEFDHHCPWLSNCIGRRNYHFFMHFIMSVSILAIYVTVCISIFFAAKVKAHGRGADFALVSSAHRGAFVTVIYAGLFAVTLSLMSLYHLVLISLDMTTREQMKYNNSKPDAESPKFTFTRCTENYLRIFCGPRPISYIPWKMYRTRRSKPPPVHSAV